MSPPLSGPTFKSVRGSAESLLERLDHLAGLTSSTPMRPAFAAVKRLMKWLPRPPER